MWRDYNAKKEDLHKLTFTNISVTQRLTSGRGERIGKRETDASTLSA